LKSLINRFHYIDLILQDTPIYNSSIFDELCIIFPDSDEYGNRNLEQRKMTVNKFIDYLAKEENKDKNFISNFEDQAIMFDVNNYLLSKISLDIDRLDKVIKNSKT